jgi:hypothetical protein
VTGARKTAIRNKLASLGIATVDLTTLVSLRFVLQKVGRHLHPGFDETRSLSIP